VRVFSISFSVLEGLQGVQKTMQQSNNLDNGELKWFCRQNDWTFSEPYKETYKEEKGIELCFKRVLYTPRSTSHLLPRNTTDLAGWSAASERRWRYLFGPRIQAILDYRLDQDLPAAFTGSPPILDRLLGDSTTGISSYAGNKLHYHQWLQFAAVSPKPDCFVIGPMLTNLHANLPWPWLYLDRPHLIQVHPVNYNRQASTTPDSNSLFNETDSLRHQLLNVATSSSSIESLLAAVHQSWYADSRPTFSPLSQKIAQIILDCQLPGLNPDLLLPILFELEAFASYSTMVDGLPLVASGFFDGRWLDIASMKIEDIRATEQCHSNRLFSELISLIHGRTAPIIINEYGCVADGNHRLTAAWIWNLLSACPQCNWELENDEFERAISRYVSQYSGSMGLVSIHEALSHLAYFLSDERYRARLILELKDSRQIFEIGELPVIAIPEYRSLTIIGEEFDRHQRYVRFGPNIYELLSNQSNTVLPARACYHFTDRVPLPWFAFAHHQVNKITAAKQFRQGSRPLQIQSKNVRSIAP
jgi:hypothetical protein